MNYDALRAKGFGEDEIGKIEGALESAFDIRFVFNKWTLGEEFCKTALASTPRDGCARFRHAETLGFSKARSTPRTCSSAAR